MAVRPASRYHVLQQRARSHNSCDSIAGAPYPPLPHEDRMSPTPTAFVRGTWPFVEAAGRLVTAFTPSTWTPDVRRKAMQRLWIDARQILPRFVLLSG